MPAITKKLYIINRSTWRKWLSENHDTQKDVWLVFYKKHTKKPSISYDDAVEEALCYGWIDTTVKRIDEDIYVRRFTKRKAGSEWSESNIRRVIKMISDGKMSQSGLHSFKGARKRIKLRSVSKRTTIPRDLKKVLEKNKKACQNFKKFAPSYKREYVRWILSAKKEETRMRRIITVVERSAKDQKPGSM